MTYTDWREKVKLTPACFQLVRQSGMLESRRYSPATSRGVIFARRTPDGPYEVVSALGLQSE